MPVELLVRQAGLLGLAVGVVVGHLLRLLLRPVAKGIDQRGSRRRKRSDETFQVHRSKNSGAALEFAICDFSPPGGLLTGRKANDPPPSAKKMPDLVA